MNTQKTQPNLLEMERVNRVMIKGIFSWRIVAALGVLIFWLTMSACLNSGVGGIGQPCNQNGLCKDYDPAATDEADLIVCCPNTGTCISSLDCYGPYVPPETGGENEPCNEDGTCDDDLVCCTGITPVLCRQAENCITEDGDEDSDVVDGDVPDGDVPDGDVPDGDDDGDVDEDIVDGDEPIEWPEEYSGQVCTDNGICWDRPWPTAGDVRGIWTSDEGSLWLVGQGGLRIQSDKEIFDGSYGANLPNLNGVHGTADDDVWAVGDDARIMHFDGDSWETVSDSVFNTVSNDGIAFNDVYADGIGNVYVIGERGSLFKLLDGDWSRLSSSTTTITLNRIWGIPGGLYVIVGDLGRVIISTDQFDFSADPVPQTLTTENLNDVWGADYNVIYAVGDNGTVLFHDNTEDLWVKIPLPFGATGGDDDAASQLPNLMGISGRNADDIYIIGDDGVIFAQRKLADDEADNPVHAGLDNANDYLLRHVWEKVALSLPTVEDGDVDGDLDADEELATPPPVATQAELNQIIFEDFKDITVTPRGEIFVVGTNGTIWGASSPEFIPHLVTRHVPRNIDTETGDISYFDVTAMRGLFTTMYVGMSNGAIYYLNLETGEWSSLGFAGVEGFAEPVNDIWVQTNGQSYFFSNAIFKWTGTAAGLTQELDEAAVGMTIERVWGFANNHLYAVGDRVIFFNGVTWDEVTEPLQNWDFSDIDGDVDGDVELESETEALSTAVSPYEWKAVWGQSETDVWLAGMGGLVAHREANPDAGQAGESDYVWRSQVLGDGGMLTDIWGADNDEIWFVGADAAVYFWDGGSFTKLSVTGAEETETFQRIWGTDAGHIFITSSAARTYVSTDGETFAQIETGFWGILSEMWGPSFNDIYFGGLSGVVVRAQELFESDEDGDVDGDADVELEADAELEVVDGDLDVEVEVELEADLEIELDGDTEVDVEVEPDEELEVDGDA